MLAKDRRRNTLSARSLGAAAAGVDAGSAPPRSRRG